MFGVADRAPGTERVVVLVETRETDPPMRLALQARVHEVVTDAAGTPPDEIVLAPPHTVPKTSSGKIRRGAARELYESDHIGPTQRVLWWQLLRLAASGTGRQLRRFGRLLRETLYAAWWWTVSLRGACLRRGKHLAAIAMVRRACRTQSLVLLCDDPDAPPGTWHHWAAYDIPPKTTELAIGAVAQNTTIEQAVNDFRKVGYGGPCPPHGLGLNHYHFRLLAFTTEHLRAHGYSPCRDIEREARKYTVGEATLVGVYQRLRAAVLPPVARVPENSTTTSQGG